MRRPVRPVVTYTLLAAMGAVLLLEEILVRSSATVAYHGLRFDSASWTFVIDTDWPWRPWTLVTSTMAHDPSHFSHILFNGLFLFFFGPLVERILGGWRFLALFFVAGAVSGIVQVALVAWEGSGGGAFGASGALMAIFGLAAMLLPRERIFIYGLLPVPMWAAALGYALLDILGAFDPWSTTGHFAHLSGLALGLGYGAWFKQDMRRRGLRLVRG